MTIFFDMDGTIADLYGVENWLPMVRNFDITPYAVAAPMLHLATFARKLNELRRCGYRIGIISWLSKNSTAEYANAVIAAKLGWLAKHLKSVEWDEIHIIPYGMPKTMFAANGDILFDDEFNNRKNWCGDAYDETAIMTVLKGL